MAKMIRAISRKLLARLEEADMVVGIRSSRKDSWPRRKISRVANLIRARWLGDGVSDAGCALIFRREVTSAFIPIRTLYSFMPALAVAAGYRVVEESVHHRVRARGNSKYSTASFLFLPIVDFIGLRWFRWRRCRGQVSSRFRDNPAIGTLGTDLHGRIVRRLTRQIFAALAAVLLLALLLFARSGAVKTRARENSLARAERAALRLFPSGVLGRKNFTRRWSLDMDDPLQAPGGRELREIEVDAGSGRVLASRIETPEEEAFEVAVEGHPFHPQHPGRR